MAPLITEGALPAGNLAEVAEQSTTVLSCLADDAAVRQVYLGPDGLIRAAQPGQVFLEHGTFAPALAREVAVAAHERGATFLDAPISGGPEGAADGTLVVMVGGPQHELERVQTVLRAYASRIEWVGDHGRGVELKLINQLLVACHLAAYAEAAALIRALQLPWDAATTVLCSGWGSSTILKRCLARAASDDFESNGADIAGLAQVEAEVLELAAEHGVALTVLPVAHALLARAVDAGLGTHDLAALVGVFQEAP
jgi:3-hydroxyisobutyrate dehydrogenase-like beta-hydroxyacid dehydrogenase